MNWFEILIIAFIIFMVWNNRTNRTRKTKEVDTSDEAVIERWLGEDNMSCPDCSGRLLAGLELCETVLTEGVLRHAAASHRLAKPGEGRKQMYGGSLMLTYLLIDGRQFIPFADKWRLFEDKDQCLEEARKLGWGQGLMSFPVGDKPGVAHQEKGGDVDLTIIPVLVHPSKSKVQP